MLLAQYNKQWVLPDSVLMTFHANDSISFEKINYVGYEATACINVIDKFVYQNDREILINNKSINLNQIELSTGVRLYTSSSETQPYVFIPFNDSIIYFFSLTYNGNGLSIAKINLNSNICFDTNELYEGNINNSVSNEKLIANKHANGRDWWILFPAFRGNTWIKFLIQENAILGYFEQNIGSFHQTENIAGRGQAKFSSNGLFLGSVTQRIELNSDTLDDTIECYYFDRLSGKLEFFKNFVFLKNSFFPYAFEWSYDNSKIFFGDFYKIGGKLICYDFEKDKLDTLLSYSDSVGLGQLMLGPDKKVYARHAGNSYLSVIENPDAPLDSLKLSYHKYKIPTLDIPAVYQPGNGLGLPYQPNYYLEPDLRAGFIVDSVSCVGRELAFTDTSQGHFWRVYDFGDGTTQKFHVTQHANLDTTRIDTHKVVYHSYKEPGTYQVKLTIVNDSSDVAPYYYDSVFTQKVIIYPSESCKENDFWFVIVPNPSPNSEVSYSLPQVGKMEIFNVLGQVILTKEIQKGIGSLPLPSDLSAGCYQVRFSSSNFKPIVKKWIKF